MPMCIFKMSYFLDISKLLQISALLDGVVYVSEKYVLHKNFFVYLLFFDEVSVAKRITI